MRPRLAIALPALALALLIALILAVLLGNGSSDRSSTATYANPAGGGNDSRFDGAALPAGIAAPDFTLTDRDGSSISLKQYRGQVTVLTFLYSTCGAACVVIAEQIRGALDDLRTPVPVLIVSANPRADTPASIGRFLTEVGLTGRVRYLTGPPARLRELWRSYRVTPASAGRAAFSRHASVLLIDRHGDERVLYQQEQLTPETLAHDIGILDGDPTHPDTLAGR
ncbi:MAG TPA: SCO family protein [Solirubrobacteraceae bacterium]|nr:SCO family protein [Solirubrobacteraceae bacterium]